ncbi:MAG: hypothetical protein GF308_18770 [Candidatus Heimdallarchaeota archaeon]|nr:hypothetical protein [Candidatus Heimdallarchaeota archaeon]
MPASLNLDKNWRQEETRKRFSTPYNIQELLHFLWNNLFGPEKKYKSMTSFIPKEIVLNQITPEITLGFIGDILPTRNREVSISRRLQKFLENCDYLVGNFEGTITHKKREVLLAQIHSQRILSDLAKIFPPERTILSCSNNHAGDFGWKVFNQSYQLLKEKNFLVIGRRDEPSILLEDKINLAALTTWTNQPCSYLSNIQELPEYFEENALFNILFPHWGYELQCFPHPNQIAFGEALLNKWDMIVGHHSHSPQPVSTSANHPSRVIAYSLGDFCIGSIFLKKYHFGIVLKVQLGPQGNNTWRIGKIEWEFIYAKIKNHKKIEIQLVSQCPFFDF